MQIKKVAAIAILSTSTLLFIAGFQNCSVPLGSSATYIQGASTTSAGTASIAPTPDSSNGTIAATPIPATTPTPTPATMPIATSNTPLPTATPSGATGICKNPDTGATMSTGSVYAYYSIPSGTASDCLMASKNSVCQKDGSVTPQVPAIHYTQCQIVAVVSTVSATPTPTPAPVGSTQATPAPTATPNTMTTTSTAAGCTGATVCDSFETVAAGAVPDASLWSLATPDCSGAGKISVDSSQAHSGKQSIRVDGGGGYCDHVFLHRSDMSSLGKDIFIRYYVRFGQALGDGHVTFMSLQDNNDSSKHLRMGGQSKILIFNRELSDASLPALSPTGIAMSVVPPANQWICVEVEVNQTAQTLTTWVNSAQVTGLAIDTTPTADVDQQWLSGSAWKPNLQDFNLGWESYGGATNTLWFDDVALSTKRIGCGQ